MSQKNQIIFISSIHRSAEKALDGLVSLRDRFDIVLFNISQASKNTNYEAASRYHKVQKKYFKNIVDAPGLRSYSHRMSKGYSDSVCSILKTLVNEKTVCVIIDDMRTHKTLYPRDIYNTVKSINHEIEVVGIPEGVKPVSQIKGAYGLGEGRRHWDKVFCIGSHDYDFIVSNNLAARDDLFIVGVPENDKVKDAISNLSEDYILVVLNFVKGGYPKYDLAKPVPVNIETFEKMMLFKLQKDTGKKIIFKIKDRMNENTGGESEHLRNILPEDLDYEIITNVECDVDLIRKAYCVLSYGSGMMLKSIMMKKPTVIFREMGFTGMFENYPGTFSVGDDYSEIFTKDFPEKQHQFLVQVLGTEDYFQSREAFSKSITKIVDNK